MKVESETAQDCCVPSTAHQLKVISNIALVYIEYGSMLLPLFSGSPERYKIWKYVAFCTEYVGPRGMALSSPQLEEPTMCPGGFPGPRHLSIQTHHSPPYVSWRLSF